MKNMLNFDLKAVDVYESIVINRRHLGHENMQVLISKNGTPLEAHKDHYAETCTVNFFPVSEESKDILDRTFSVRVTIVGVFHHTEPSEEVDMEKFKDLAYQELFPHLRAALATAMTNAGIAPYYIPTSFCK